MAAARFVYVQRAQAVDVLDPRTLRRLHVVGFGEDVHDVASSGATLFVSAGRTIRIFTLGDRGRVSLAASVPVPKPAHAITAAGGVLYALDDVLVPLYVHRVDASLPASPWVATLQVGGVNAHLGAQAIADRWYVTQTYATMTENGQDLLVLPARPPLRVLARRSLARLRKTPPVEASGPGVTEFRVFDETLYGIQDTGGRLRVVRRSVAAARPGFDDVADLGAAPDVDPPPRGIIELVVPRLYVAAGRSLMALDLGSMQPPVRVITLPAPIISLAVVGPGP